MYWKSILVTALHTDYGDANYKELKITLRRFYYLYWVAGHTLSKIKGVSFNVIKAIKDKKPIAEISKDLEAKISDDKVIDTALENLDSDNVVDEKWIKPLLLLLEYNVNDNKKPAFIELDTSLHLEHILPQRYRSSEWQHINDADYNAWINSVGNLTLLSGSKNIEASNNSFDVKMDVYRGKGKYGLDDNKITAFQITQHILKDYEDGKFDKQWNVQAMINRRKWFFTEVGKLLDIDVSEQINKHQPE